MRARSAGGRWGKRGGAGAPIAKRRKWGPLPSLPRLPEKKEEEEEEGHTSADSVKHERTCPTLGTLLALPLDDEALEAEGFPPQQCRLVPPSVGGAFQP